MGNKKILIFGSYSGYNKGDLAILCSIIRAFQRINKNLSFCVPSKNPAELGKYLPAEKVDVYKTLTPHFGFKTWRYLKKVDVLFFGGGGLFFDSKLFNPFYSHLLNLFFIAFINNVFFGKKLFLLSVGASHINSKTALFMVRYIIKSAFYVSARDEYTCILFERLLGKPVTHVMDPAFLVEAKRSDYVDHFIKKLDKKRVAVCVNSHLFSSCHSIIKGLLEYTKYFSDSGSVVICTNTTASGEANRLVDLCGQKNMYVFDVASLSPEEIAYFYSNFNYVVSMPMHAAILAYCANVNLATINYNDKVSEFNNLIGNKNFIKVSTDVSLLALMKDFKSIDFSKKTSIKDNVIRNYEKINALLYGQEIS